MQTRAGQESRECPQKIGADRSSIFRVIVSRVPRTLYHKLTTNQSCVTAFQVINQFHDWSTIGRNLHPSSNYLSKFNSCKIHQKQFTHTHTHTTHLLLLCLRDILHCSSGFPFSTVLHFVPLDSSHPNWNNAGSLPYGNTGSPCNNIGSFIL